MKKTLLQFTLCLLFSSLAIAQAPQGINYQSVARDGTGQILANHLISIKFVIHDSIPAGPVVYSEGQSATTNSIGIFSTVIGAGGVIIGHFPNINWGVNNKYLQVLMDFNGGTNYTDMGTSQFMSVPFSLYANASLGDITNAKYDTAGVLNISTPTTTFSTGKGAWTTSGNGSLSINNFIGTTDNIDFILKGHGIEGIRIAAGGALLASGSNPLGVTPASGAGTRLMWIPAKAALRAGTVTGTAWDNANIGTNSIAMGTDVLVSGTGASSIGSNNTVTATNASAFGNGLIVTTMGATAVGSYNDTTGSGSPTSSSPTDPVFVVGSGTGAAARGNAMSVSKNGIITANAFNFVPSAPIAVSGTATINVGSSGFIILTASTGASSNHVILGPGQKIGQLLIIETQISGGSGHGITFDDNVAVNHMNLANTYQLIDQNVITLVWDGNSWVQVSVSLN